MGDIIIGALVDEEGRDWTDSMCQSTCIRCSLLITAYKRLLTLSTIEPMRSKLANYLVFNRAINLHWQH